MSNFKSLQAQHEILIKKAQEGQDIIADAQNFIEEVKASSSQISPSSERDQLRSNLRYWASYVYERTGNYPNVDLAPSNLRPRPNWILPAVIGILVLLGVCFALPFLQAPISPAPTPTDIPDLPLETASPTLTLIEPTQSVVPTLENAISVQLTSVHDGDEVFADTTLSGTYSNIPAGYSIHVIIEPLSQKGRQFPMPKYSSVNPNSTSGEWTIDAKFGQSEELKDKEQYLIYLAVADENGRQKLSDLVDEGFTELPPGVLLFPQPVRVSRAAVSLTEGDRLLYSSFVQDEGNYEIYSSHLDGSDPRRITYTSAINEYFPSLSPDGKRIVYVANRRDKSNSVEIINSDGTSPETIIEQQKNTIESTIWSSEDNYIAYILGKPQRNNQLTWDVLVYDLQKKQSLLVKNDNKTSLRYISWVPKSSDLLITSRLPSGRSGFVRINILKPEEDPIIFFEGNGEAVQSAVSPDGSLLAYLQLDDRIGNIYVADIKTRKIRQLTHNLVAASSPVWSPDGKTIFYQYYLDGFYNIWSVNPDGGEPIQITFGNDVDPFAGRLSAFIP